MNEREMIDEEMQYRDLYTLEVAIADIVHLAGRLRDGDYDDEEFHHLDRLGLSIRIDNVEKTLAALKDLVKK